MSWRNGGLMTCKVCHCTLPYTMGPDACERCQPGVTGGFKQEYPETISVPSVFTTPAAQEQPAPTPGGAEVTVRVVQDLLARSDMGKEKYGTRLTTNNGRDALMDAYQEALDLCCYLKQAIMERGVV